MTLQAKLTLGTVLLATVIVAVISAAYLRNVMDLQFESALQRAEMAGDRVVSDVRETLNSHQELPLPEALASGRLSEQLKTEVTYSKEIFEVAVVDPDNTILADSDAERRGERCARYGNLGPLVNQADWYQKLQVLLPRGDASYYQVERKMGPPEIFVRVIVAPAFIREYMREPLEGSAHIALLSVIGAISLTFLFSAFAFRPLGRLRRQLDLLARGEYEPEKPARKPSNDEVSIMSSKVSLLGERLRGAQYEVSDLRGNIDRLLQDLEDAVLIFNRDSRLVFASGSVARFLGRERAALSGESIAVIFPPSTNLGFLIAQASATGMVIRNRRIPLEPEAEGAGAWRSRAAFRGPAGGAVGQPHRACWCACAIPRRNARSAANCRPPTGWRPSAASPAAWPTR